MAQTLSNDPGSQANRATNPKSAEAVKVQFRLIDRDGQRIPAESILSIFGKCQWHESTAVPGNPIVKAVQDVREGNFLGAEQRTLLRSFLSAWLERKESDSSGVSEIAAACTEVPASIVALHGIGAFGRGVKATAALGVQLGGAALLLDDMLGGGHALQGDLGEALIELPDERRKVLDERYGLPGQKRPLDSFSADAVVAFLRYAQMLPVVEKVDASDQLKRRLQTRAQHQVLTAFLVNSRQIEGVAMNGSTATSAVVGAHAALALGVSELPNKDMLIEWLGREVSAISDAPRREEAQKTFDALKSNLTKETSELSAQLAKHLAMSRSVELSDWATFPVSLTFRFMEGTCGLLGGLSKETPLAAPFNALAVGFRHAASTTEATPAVIGVMLRTGASVEQAIRETASSIIQGARQAVSGTGTALSGAGDWVAGGVRSLWSSPTTPPEGEKSQQQGDGNPPA
jgi:hypothetical protein